MEDRFVSDQGHRLWAGGVIISCLSLVILTPGRIGQRPWAIARIPVVLLLIVTWVGFVVALIAKRAVPKSGEPSDEGEVDLSVAARPSDTVVASARFASKLAVTVLGLVCTSLAFWDGFLRASPQWLHAGIWATAAIALAFYLAKLLRRRVILAPATISWSDHGQTVSKRYEEVRDFQVLSRSEIRVVFSDGQKLAVTSDMADLKKVLATITVRRLA